MLLNLLKNKNCFKLVCGAGNENAREVERLVCLYSLAGCNFFDICAKEEILDAAKRGLELSKISKDRYLCCSVGLEGDPHISKAQIDDSKCVNCNICTEVCFQDAVTLSNNKRTIDKQKCIGCQKCIKKCPKNCIELKSQPCNLEEILPPLIKKGIDCIEFHIEVENEQDIDSKWEIINNLFSGLLSISINRSILGDDKIISRIERLLKTRKPYTTIIQADGVPMSGGVDDYRTTLQALSMVDLIQGMNLDAFVMMSGGTNTKSTFLAKKFDLKIDAIAIGSFARQIVKEYIKRDDFYNNKEIFNKALAIAKNLVETSLENMS